MTIRIAPQTNPSLFTSISRTARLLTAALAALLLSQVSLPAQQVAASAMTQIESLLAEKNARTPAQQKMDSQLIYLTMQTNRASIPAAIAGLEVTVNLDKRERVLVDIRGTVSDGLLKFIGNSGGLVENSLPQFKAVRARLPIEAIEALAGREDVSFVEPAVEVITNVVVSEADRTHRADTARATLVTKGGSGIKIGVLSNGVDTLATSIANGELNPDTSVIPGQASTGNEGTAMMELIQDLAPNAKLYFATGNGGTANMANNILLLQAAGCTVIVDDLTYLNESPFQDQVISQAVNTVSAAGVMYFSSARNSGSLRYGNGFEPGTGAAGSSGTWEGDWADGGAATGIVGGKAGSVLNFGGGVTANAILSGDNVTTNPGSSGRVDLFWSDPNGASSNDYDLFVLNSTSTSVLRSSTNTQNGTQDPYEAVSPLNPGEKVVVVKTTAAAARFIHLDVGRRYLTVGTAGNVRGHNAAGAANAFSVAATDVHNSPSPAVFVGGATNPAEYFSSDGPRRIFYNPGSTTPITPGNVSSTGGLVLLKPDFTAADGASTSVSGFLQFYGTSAAAPHAAAITALIKAYNPALTPAQIRTALTSTSLDIEAAGFDNVAGTGIIMALPAMQALPTPDPLSVTGSFLDAKGGAGGPFTPTTTTYTLKNNGVSSLNWTATKTQSWVTLGATGGTLGAGSSVSFSVSLTTAINAFSSGSYSDTVTFTNTTTGIAQTRAVTVSVTQPAPANDNFVNATLLTGVRLQISGTNTTYATKEAGEPNHALNAGGHSVWWKWVAPGSRPVTITTFGSTYDTLLAVYTGSAVNALSTIAYNDDAPGMGIGVPSSLSFTTVAGTTYYIAVDGWKEPTDSGATGSVVLNLAFSVAPISDFNGDSKSDILWSNNTTGERAMWLMNGGTVTTGASLGIVPTAWKIVGTGDFDGNGKGDVLLFNTTTGDRAMWLMNGSTIANNIYLGNISTAWTISAVGDFNGDGKSDIFWSNSITGDRSMWLMNGGTVTTGAYLGTVPVEWKVNGTGDFNGDGKADLVWTNTTTGDRSMWLMDGITLSVGASLGNLPVAWKFSRVGDFNGDGKADIVLSNSTTGDRAMWLMNASTVSSNLYLGNVAVVWTISSTGDFNGDGKADIMWSNGTTGDRSMWLMNGGTVTTGAYLGSVPTDWVNPP